MTPRTPQVGDTITTAEELDALPVGSAVLARGKDVWTHVPADKYTHWLGIELSEDDHYIEPRQHWLRDAASERGVVILHLPGRPPRPEREVKAEALREAAADVASIAPYGAELRPDGSEDRLIAAWVEGLRDAHVAILDRADRIARGDH